MLLPDRRFHEEATGPTRPSAALRRVALKEDLSCSFNAQLLQRAFQQNARAARFRKCARLQQASLERHGLGLVRIPSSWLSLWVDTFDVNFSSSGSIEQNVGRTIAREWNKPF